MSDQSAAVLAESEASEKPGCPKCGYEESWGCASWCPRCGYYPKLGTVAVADVEQLERQEEDEQPKNLWELIPAWGWILMGGMLVPLAASILGRVLTPDDSWERTYWTLGQCTVGIGLLLVGHAWSYMRAIMMSDKIAVFDFFFKPGVIWSVTIQQLPGSARRIWLGSWGLAAIVSALAITGGIRYSALFDDWGFKKRAQTNLLKEITKQAREFEGEGADSLDDAIEDFAGEEGVNAGALDKPDIPVAEEKRETMDCLIIGYLQEPDEATFTDLLVAAMVDGKLQFVAAVSEGVSDEARQELELRFKQLRRKRPLVRCAYKGQWLQPVLMCRISSTGWLSTGKLGSPRFESLLADVEP